MIQFPKGNINKKLQKGSKSMNGTQKLTLKDITHYYESAKGDRTHTIDKVNLKVDKGEFLAIVGSSGCGKSTLLNIMSGMLKPTKGEVLIEGDTLNYEKHRIGYISQSDTLLPWRKIVDNVALGLELRGVSKAKRRELATELMETSGLKGFEDKYTYELSGGMKKRAIIIRALAQNPDIIFMDEPFGPLDVFTKELLQTEILDIWEERKSTIVYITHDISEAIILADRIILMSYRPSSIKAEYIVDLPRPRNIIENKLNPKFVELEKRIWNDIKSEVVQARKDEMSEGNV